MRTIFIYNIFFPWDIAMWNIIHDKVKLFSEFERWL